VRIDVDHRFRQPIHRPDCREIPEGAILELHAAGTAVRRDVAPKACWTCEPEIEMMLAV
jgi:hypothetical protein